MIIRTSAQDRYRGGLEIGSCLFNIGQEEWDETTSYIDKGSHYVDFDRGIDVSLYRLYSEAVVVADSSHPHFVIISRCIEESGDDTARTYLRQFTNRRRREANIAAFYQQIKFMLNYQCIFVKMEVSPVQFKSNPVDLGLLYRQGCFFGQEEYSDNPELRRILIESEEDIGIYVQCNGNTFWITLIDEAMSTVKVEWTQEKKTLTFAAYHFADVVKSPRVHLAFTDFTQMYTGKMTPWGEKLQQVYITRHDNKPGLGCCYILAESKDITDLRGVDAEFFNQLCTSFRVKLHDDRFLPLDHLFIECQDESSCNLESDYSPDFGTLLNPDVLQHRRQLRSCHHTHVQCEDRTDKQNTAGRMVESYDGLTMRLDYNFDHEDRPENQVEYCRKYDLKLVTCFFGRDVVTD